MTILEAVRDPQLFARWFSEPSWRRWMVALAAIFALPLSDLEPFGIASEEAVETFRRFTGRTTWPTQPAREFWGLMGRRAGKTLLMALAAVYLAAFRRYRLKPGERGTLMLLAADKRQARVLRRYIGAFFEHVPLLAAMVTHQTAEGIDLDNGVTIEIHVASYRSTRGYTLVAAIVDEIAFLRTDELAAEPDAEILNAIRPGLATLQGLLICITSPYGKRGETWKTYRRHWGQDSSDVLVWKAATREMNPTITEAEVARAYERDEHAARSEWGGEFRDDVLSFVDREMVEALVDEDDTERIPRPGVRYVAHCDPSGGRADSMTLAIAHRLKDEIVLDALVERRPPFDPDVVVEEFAGTLRLYALANVQTDNYAAEWVVSAFRRAGVVAKPAERTTSQHYAELLPQITGARLRLINEPRLVHQLAQLERKVTGTGREVITHPPGGHDDLAAALAGAVAQVARPHRRTVGMLSTAEVYDLNPLLLT